MRTLILYIVLPYTFLSLSCANSAFQKVQSSNTIQDYENFIKRFPNNEFTNQAVQNLDSLNFELSKDINTISAYNRYLSRSTIKRYKEEALNRIEKLHFLQSRSNNTILSYKNYLSKYPNGNFADSANKSIIIIDFFNTKSTNTIEAYNQFLLKYPNSIFADSIKLIIEKIDFNVSKTKNTVEGYKHFLNIYPNGNFNDSAMSLLETTEYKNALLINTIKVFDSFLVKYPQSQYKGHVNNLKIKKILTNKDKALQHLKNHPYSIYSNLIKIKYNMNPIFNEDNSFTTSSYPYFKLITDKGSSRLSITTKAIDSIVNMEKMLAHRTEVDSVSITSHFVKSDGSILKIMQSLGGKLIRFENIGFNSGNIKIDKEYHIKMTNIIISLL